MPCCLRTMILVLLMEKPPHRRKFSGCWRRNGMPVEKIALLLRIKTELAREIVADVYKRQLYDSAAWGFFIV